MKNCADNILILFYFIFYFRKKGALSWPSEKNPLAKRWSSEKVTFAKRSPVAGQNCTIPRRPPNRDKRRRLSRFHAYSDVALKPTLIRRYKVRCSFLFLQHIWRGRNIQLSRGVHMSNILKYGLRIIITRSYFKKKKKTEVILIVKDFYR